MNLFKLSFVLLVLVFAASCEDDEDMTPACVQSDWVGTYVGDLVCEDEDNVDVTLTFTANGTDMLDFAYETDDFSASSVDPIPFDGCEINYTVTEGNITLTIRASLDGDNITFEEPFGCVIEAVRQ